MARILVLDDSRLRLQKFVWRFAADNTLIQTSSAGEAIEALKRYPKFDTVYLDHDLAEEHYRELYGDVRDDFGNPVYSPGTGMDVVDFLCDPENAKYRPTQVIVHSWNAARAPIMVMALENAGIPACWQRYQG